MKWIDLPPVWLLASLGIAYVWRWPASWSGMFWPGLILLVLALGLVIAAVLEFARARTTIVPHRSATALITSGIFGYSRNPIYLADLAVLAGFSLIWGSLPGLCLVPVLGLILWSRFIRGEEARLAADFGAEFESYRNRTRRWL